MPREDPDSDYEPDAEDDAAARFRLLIIMIRTEDEMSRNVW
jgi:hypothetical protein